MRDRARPGLQDGDRDREEDRRGGAPEPPGEPRPARPGPARLPERGHVGPGALRVREARAVLEPGEVLLRAAEVAFARGEPGAEAADLGPERDERLALPAHRERARLVLARALHGPE